MSGRPTMEEFEQLQKRVAETAARAREHIAQMEAAAEEWIAQRKRSWRWIACELEKARLRERVRALETALAKRTQNGS